MHYQVDVVLLCLLAGVACQDGTVLRNSILVEKTLTGDTTSHTAPPILGRTELSVGMTIQLLILANDKIQMDLAGFDPGESLWIWNQPSAGRNVPIPFALSLPWRQMDGFALYTHSTS